MKKILVICLTVVMALTMLAACALPAEKPSAEATEAPTVEATEAPSAEASEAVSDEANPLTGIKVGFSQMENNMPWRIGETNSMKNEAAARGVELVYTDAQSDSAKQANDIESLIAQQVDYLVIAPREAEGLQSVLEDAEAAGIPVILVDRDTKGERLTFIHSDLYLEGQQCAEILAQALGGKGNVVELTGTEGSSAAIDRQKGFMDVISSKYPDIKVIMSQTGNFSRIEGKDVMANILQAQGENIDAVYAHNDEMGLGAIEAIEADGRFVPGKDILIASIDGQKSGLEAVIDGKFVATVECSPFFGPIVFDIIEQHLAGVTPESDIINPDRIFTIDGANGTTKAADAVDSAY